MYVRAMNDEAFEATGEEVHAGFVASLGSAWVGEVNVSPPKNEASEATGEEVQAGLVASLRSIQVSKMYALP